VIFLVAFGFAPVIQTEHNLQKQPRTFWFRVVFSCSGLSDHSMANLEER
jgi:hypothetical protein